MAHIRWASCLDKNPRRLSFKLLVVLFVTFQGPTLPADMCEKSILNLNTCIDLFSLLKQDFDICNLGCISLMLNGYPISRGYSINIYDINLNCHLSLYLSIYSIEQLVRLIGSIYTVTRSYLGFEDWKLIRGLIEIMMDPAPSNPLPPPQGATPLYLADITVYRGKCPKKKSISGLE